MSHAAGMQRPTLTVNTVSTILGCFPLYQPLLTPQEITKHTELPASTCQRLVQDLLYDRSLDLYGDAYRTGIDLVRWGGYGCLQALV